MEVIILHDALISVVIPVYNVQEYLSECIDCILKQTYKNLEIILVDDGSTDDCGVICDDYAENDERILVIHKENGGLSSARNAGIEVASGVYIGFIDSDDGIDLRMFEILENCFEQDPEIDIAVCGYQEVTSLGVHKSFASSYKSRSLSGKEAAMLMLNANERFNVTAWNKLYKRSLFCNLRYPDGYNHEDMYVTPKLLYESHKVAYVPIALYYHRYNPNSIVHGGYKLKSQDEILGVEAMRSYFICVNYMSAVAKVNRIYLWKLIDHYSKTKIFLQDGSLSLEIYQKYLAAYAESRRNVDCTALEKIQFLCFKFFPKAYVFARKAKYIK